MIADIARTQNIVRLNAMLPAGIRNGFPLTAFATAARVHATPIPIKVQ